MNKLLKNNLYTKLKLSFNADDRFKILMFSDIQEIHSFDEKTIKNINIMLDDVKPDMVILGGDQCVGKDIPSKSDFEAFLSILATPLEERKIPWVHIFGNHDYELNFPLIEQQNLYENYSFCLSKHTQGISGMTNFMIPIYHYNSQKIGFNIWALDTQKHSDRFISDYNIKEYIDVGNRQTGTGGFDLIRFDQMLWYWNSSLQLEKYAGAKIPSIMCMHVAPAEFSVAINKSELCKLNGNCPEQLNGGMFNSGIFSEILQRGDVCGICCAHSHRNNFEASLFGVKIYFDGTAGMRCYGEDKSRGGRVFEIDAKDPWHIKSYSYLYKNA